MLKFLLSIFMLLLMPFRLLFVLSILLNIALGLAIHSFIIKDTYFETAEEFFNIKEKSEKMLDGACNFGVKCTITIYAKAGEKLKETFAKTINEEKQPQKQKALLEALREPVIKLLQNNELKKLIKKEDGIAQCVKNAEDSMVCATGEVVAIFKAQKCESCLEKFKKEFKVLDKKYYKSFLIKLTHKIHNYVLSLFDICIKEEKLITEKPKNKFYENIADF